MYASHFGLKQAPFSIAPDPRYLFMSDRHREALAHLLYGVGGGGGFVLLTGSIGAGKTTVCRCFLEQIPRRCNVAYIFNPKLNAVELLRTVCEEFRIPCPESPEEAQSIKALVDRINEYLLRTHGVGQNNVLIIDEAQNLAPEVLEQLRLLTNLETNERKLLQIILIGQPELRDLLARPEMEQVAQRVIARFHLDALSPAETAQYIQHRLSVAGHRRGRLFTDEALGRIHEWTQGVPRRINLLCDRALLGAYAEDRPQVDRRIVDKAAAEVFEGHPRVAALMSAAAPSTPSKVWLVGSGALMLGAVVMASVWTWTHHQGGDHPLTTRAVKATPSTPAPPPASASLASKNVTRPPGTAASSASGGLPDTAASTLPVSDASTVLLNAWPSQDEARRTLARQWTQGASLADDGAPCPRARALGLWCFEAEGGLPQLQQLDRPAVLTLENASGQKVYALLTRLTTNGAELQLRTGPTSVSLGTLAAVWRGVFGTYWVAPEGYRGALERGQRGPAVDWLWTQLSLVQGQSAPEPGTPFNADLLARVQAFQLASGLKPDGVAGSTTMMLLNRVAKVDEPPLKTAPALTPAAVPPAR